MSKTVEHKTLQNRTLKYTQEIGRTFVTRDQYTSELSASQTKEFINQRFRI